MKTFRYPLGQLQANCYFLINDQNNCLIIDPGDEGVFLLEEIERKKLKPLAILATHGHFDHLMAVGVPQQTFHKLSFYINKKDLFLLERLDKTGEYFLGYRSAIIPVKKNSINFSEEASCQLIIVTEL